MDIISRNIILFAEVTYNCILSSMFRIFCRQEQFCPIICALQRATLPLCPFLACLDHLVPGVFSFPLLRSQLRN